MVIFTEDTEGFPNPGKTWFCYKGGSSVLADPVSSVREFTIPLAPSGEGANYGEALKMARTTAKSALCTGQVPRVRASGSDFSLQSHVEDVKTIDGFGYHTFSYRDFPYPRAEVFREKLLSKICSFDPEGLLEGASRRLTDLVIRGEVDSEDCPSSDGMSGKYCHCCGADPVADLCCISPCRTLSGGRCCNEKAASSQDANPFAVLRDCSRSGSLMGKAKALVRLFQSLGLNRRIGIPITEISCGGLYEAVRNQFPQEVGPYWELSFKTVRKCEKNACQACIPRFLERLSAWKESRARPQVVDDQHLSRFGKAFRRNVSRGWDRYRSPFIPNGHASLLHSRRKGGNWNREPFSSVCGARLVFSSGKPRVVTCYSSFNTAVLAPLHYSLYSYLKRFGWLLVGDPKDEDIRNLNGNEFVSIDYSAATDNIKSAYVKKAVEILIDQADYISDDELRCLHVFSELSLDDCDSTFESGQPMGSVLSFPLLCLINKTVIDMAIDDLLESGSIQYSEWVSHRCLINGDDTLFREPTTNGGMRERVIHHGRSVGLIVNEEKTMVSPFLAEINSTLFSPAGKSRKVNASALWMDSDVSDVLGFAHQASDTPSTFLRFARANAHILSKQPRKEISSLPANLKRLVRRDKKLRKACTSLPDRILPVESGPIGMCVAPTDYDLTREEENEAMSEEVERVRDSAIRFFQKRPVKPKVRPIRCAQSFNRASKPNLRKSDELIPSCYVRRFNLKRWEDVCGQVDTGYDDGLEIPPFDGRKIDQLVDHIRNKRANNSPVKECEGFEPDQDFIRL